MVLPLIMHLFQGVDFKLSEFIRFGKNNKLEADDLIFGKAARRY